MDRYITLVVKADEDVVASMQEQLREGTEAGLQLVLAGSMTIMGAWATDKNPAAERRHLVELSARGWTIQHSWDCRLAGDLFACGYNAAARVMGELLEDEYALRGTGRYALQVDDESGAVTIGERITP